MSEHRFENGVRALLTTQLDSFEKLEIVRALRASAHVVSTEALEVTCRFTSELIRETLNDLERARIIEREGGSGDVRLGTRSKAPEFEALMQLYEGDRSHVLSVLSSQAMERIRLMAARAFADAFLIRRKRGDDDG